MHAAKWVLAMVGVAVLYLALQIAVAMMGGTVLAFVEVALHGDEGAYGEALAKSAIYGNGIQVVLVAFQLIAVAVFLPWWRRMRPGSFAQRREDLAPKGASRAKTVAALLLVGIAAQFFVSGLLGLVEMFAPEAIAEYSEMMADSSTGIFVLVAAVSTAILAPINEEIVCRGIMLEYAMRAVSPWWSARERARRHAVSARAFWVANILQALAFGVLHMNLIQGSYAFALGIVEGWVFWRTGKLRYSILLHFALNASSYLVAPLAPYINMPVSYTHLDVYKRQYRGLPKPGSRVLGPDTTRWIEDPVRRGAEGPLAPLLAPYNACLAFVGHAVRVFAIDGEERARGTFLGVDGYGHALVALRDGAVGTYDAANVLSLIHI